jgi:hypothetical protein
VGDDVGADVGADVGGAGDSLGTHGGLAASAAATAATAAAAAAIDTDTTPTTQTRETRNRPPATTPQQLCCRHTTTATTSAAPACLPLITPHALRASPSRGLTTYARKAPAQSETRAHFLLKNKIQSQIMSYVSFYHQKVMTRSTTHLRTSLAIPSRIGYIYQHWESAGQSKLLEGCEYWGVRTCSRVSAKS